MIGQAESNRMMEIENTCPHGNLGENCLECKGLRLKDAFERVEGFYTDYGTEGKERVGIDEELKPLIAVFLAMGLETDGSCFGHPEKRAEDQSDLEYGEKNYLPYVSFSGYQPNDGLSPGGESIGYTESQVDAACEKMTKDHAILKNLLDKFYTKHKYQDHWITLKHHKGMPNAQLDTLLRLDFNDNPDELDDKILQQTHEQWTAFIEFAKQEFLK